MEEEKLTSPAAGLERPDSSSSKKIEDGLCAHVTEQTAPERPVTEQASVAEAEVKTDPAKNPEPSAAVEAEEKTVETADKGGEEGEKEQSRKGIRGWWDRHKPTKRRLIQVYAALLYNANIKGFITGDIFTGLSKTVCVPGLNCYSCPGAVGACPLGALQNALAGTKARAPYYMLGIILLYGLILGRTICGFLCPVGLAQDLLYKIRTPKAGKNRFTRLLSWLKYVILALLVVGIPLVYALDRTAVPGFCKYICPAGTFGGAMLLLINPANDWMFAMLGGLFTWKAAVCFAVMAGSIFVYRLFCRFLCPLGALYGLFNKIALLGIKVDRSKCIDCGKCIKKCKMDVKKVGDHECINCGECKDVCPTGAIVWKGGKVFLKATEPALGVKAKESEPPVSLAAFAAKGKAETAVPEKSVTAHDPEISETACASANDAAKVQKKSKKAKPATAKKRRGREFWFKLTAIAAAALLYIGVFVYANFIYSPVEASVTAEYRITVGLTGNETGTVKFKLGDDDGYVVPDGKHAGSESDPYVIGRMSGVYAVNIVNPGDVKYFKYTASAAQDLSVTVISENGDKLDLKIMYVIAGTPYVVYDRSKDGDKNISLDLKVPDGFGNELGYVCYDFTLEAYNDQPRFKLSEHRGKVTVINFWGVWCGPCVQELPEFERVRVATGVDMVAVHNVSKDDVQAFLNAKGWNEWGITFVQDTGTAARSDIFTLLGGKNNAYPRTLVLDKNGVIRFIFDGKISEERLTKAIETLQD